MTAKQPEQLDGTRLRRGRARRFAGSVAAAALGRAVTPLLSLAITPYALSKLGAERFGLFALALAVCGWLALVDVGLSAGLRVVLARQSGDLETAKLRPLLGATAAGQAALAALGLA
ncbi:MAG: hypothetical protein H6509_03340, partial [Bryobacterales bacterium]|nr:hypothetical protein [Bryobacterales bacterium]